MLIIFATEQSNHSQNIPREDDPFELVQIPDVLPSEHLSESDEMSFVAGEFIAVYR